MPAAVVLAIILIQCLPAAQAALEFDRHAVGAGQVWRLLTCHLTHWSWSHLAADLAAFVVLYWLVCSYGCHGLTRSGWPCSLRPNMPTPENGRGHGTHKLTIAGVPGRGRPYRLFGVLAASAVAVGLAVHFGAGDITIYRGLSGVNYALLGWVLIRATRGVGRLKRIACLGLLAAIAAKIALEVAGISLLPGIGLPEGIATVGVAHAAGLIVGTSAAGKTWKTN